MARLMRAALESSLKEVDAQAHILQLGMHCALAGEIEWIANEKEKDGAKYKFGVARLTDPHGGLFFTRFDFPGQNPSFNVAYLDQVISDCRAMPSSEFARVRVHGIDKAVTMRYKAIANLD